MGLSATLLFTQRRRRLCPSSLTQIWDTKYKSKIKGNTKDKKIRPRRLLSFWYRLNKS
jgi:hypothetical protein